MTNADKFKSLFGLYATELWAMPEKDFLKWLNSEAMNCSEFPNNSDTVSRRQALDAVRRLQTYKLFEGDDMLLIDKAEAQTELMMLPSAQPEIVRCKDCKHYHTDVFGGEIGINGMYENLIVGHSACDRWSEYMNSVDPDGFCFLAKRRTDE